MTSSTVGARQLARKAFAPAEKAAPARAVKLGADEGIVVAIVAVTGVTDLANDLIVPGAFAKTLAKRRPKVVDDHSWSNKRGRVEHVEEWLPGDPRLPKTTKDGKPWPAEAGALVATMRYAMDTEVGREAYLMVKFYAETNEAEFSIGYNVPDGMARKRADGVRIILQMDLFEFSHVLFGAHPMTMALEVKSMNGGAGGDVTVGALERTQKVGGPVEDDEDEPVAPGMPDKPWDAKDFADHVMKEFDRVRTLNGRASTESKSAAAVVLEANHPHATEAKTSEEAMTDTKTLETKQFSKMKGSYEERAEAISDAAKVLFSAILSCDADDVYAWPVATYPTEVVMNVGSCRGGESATYLIAYTVDPDTLAVAMEQPEKVTLSLIAEPEGGAAQGLDPEATEDAIESAVIAPILAAVGASRGLETKAAELVHAAMRDVMGLEAKSAEYDVDARPDGAEPHGPVFDKDNLPDGEWGDYVKSGSVKCTPMVGKYSVKTQEGMVNAEDGWLALDKGDHPYPISDDEFDASYVPHGEKEADPEGDLPPIADDETNEDPAEEATETPTEEATEATDEGDEAAEDPTEEATETPDAEAAETAAGDTPDDPDTNPAADDTDLEPDGQKTAPKGEFEGKNDLVTLDPDEHFSMRDDLQSGLDSQLEDRNKNN